MVSLCGDEREIINSNLGRNTTYKFNFWFKDQIINSNLLMMTVNSNFGEEKEIINSYFGEDQILFNEGKTRDSQFPLPAERCRRVQR